MGFSEWGFRVNNNDEIQNIYDIISLHNLHVKAGLLEAEKLDIYAIIRRRISPSSKARYYLCAGNGGGSEATSNFLAENYTGSICFPHCKPHWWKECQDYAWRSEKKDEVPSFETFASSV